MGEERTTSVPKQSPTRRCRICDKPIKLETAKIDEEGKAVHEECYVRKLRLQEASQSGHAQSIRQWKVVAAEISREPDPRKITELIIELNQALDEQNPHGTIKPRSDGKPKPDG